MYQSYHDERVLCQMNGTRKRKLSVSDVDEPSLKHAVIDRVEVLRRGHNKRCRVSTSSSYLPHSRKRDENDSSGGYDSQRECKFQSTRACWRSAAVKRRGLCKCKRHSDSGLTTKSTQIRSVRRRQRQRTACRSKVMVDEEGHLLYKEGDVLNDRYELGRTLGQGTFGKVVECKDLHQNRHRVAMKIVRKGCQDYESAMMEVKVLQELRPRDCHERGHCIEMLDWFDYYGHICIVFEMLGYSIYEFLRRNSYRPFPIEQVQHIGYQLCRAVLYCHERGLTHTDLKPENILFTDSSYVYVDSSSRRASSRTTYRRRDCGERRVKCTDIRLIDFGSAIFDYERHASVISTRQYRAPEVVLDLGWTEAADVWSIGCIMMELYTGKTLFQSHSGLQHLAMMERVLGPVPRSMASATRVKSYFRDGRLNWDRRSHDGRKVDQKCRPLKTYLTSKSSIHADFLHLVSSMLSFRPSERIGLRAALHHPFFECSSVRSVHSQD